MRSKKVNRTRSKGEESLRQEMVVVRGQFCTRTTKGVDGVGTETEISLGGS